MPDGGGVSGFAAIRGHDRVREFLRIAATHERLPHALLFTGPEGVGKRLLATALAAWLHCDAPGTDACGRCARCHQLAAQSHPDFQLVTVAAGKKEIGVDRAREVKRFTQLRPVCGKVKIAIVDDAQLLTVAAQNALLKTLEEPPGHSLLILVVNNADALLPTVRSRCQRIQFAPLPTEVVVEILIERHGIEASLAPVLARLSEGSPGRALALSSCVGTTSSEPLLSRLIGAAGARYAELAKLAHDLARPDAETGIKLDLLLSQLRDQAVHAVGAGHLATASLAEASDLQVILRRVHAVDAARDAIRRGNPNRQLLLEALVLRLAGPRG